MILEALVRYLHFISILTLVAAVAGQQLLIRERLPRREIRRLAVLDAIYGVSAITVVLAGLTLWFWTGKNPEFYSYNWIFLTKVGLALLLGIVSIHPTLFFARNRKGDNLEELIDVPSSVRGVIRFELLLLVLIPLGAVLMARGIGYFG